VWSAAIENEAPYIKLYPRGTSHYSPLWTEAEKEVKARHPHWDLHDAYVQKLIRKLFKKQLTDMGCNCIMNPPKEIWVLEKGHM
jgi:hypothetical protein